MNDSVMITSAVDAHEGRVVVTCDIPGALVDPTMELQWEGGVVDRNVSV
jgi:hypothetical protein